MVTKKRTKWQGWIKVEDVPPDLLEKFRQYNARYRHYCKILSSPSHGTGNTWDAHSKARQDVPLTDAEMNIRKRLSPFDWDGKE